MTVTTTSSRTGKSAAARFNETVPELASPRPPSPKASRGVAGRPFAKEVDLILSAPRPGSPKSSKPLHTLIRKGSPTKRERPTSAVNRPTPNLAVGTSSKGAKVLTDIWMEFQGGEKAAKPKKKRRGRGKISSSAGRAIGGVMEATRILDGWDDDDEDSQENVEEGEGEDIYCDYKAVGDVDVDVDGDGDMEFKSYLDEIVAGSPHAMQVSDWGFNFTTSEASR